MNSGLGPFCGIIPPQRIVRVEWGSILPPLTDIQFQHWNVMSTFVCNPEVHLLKYCRSLISAEELTRSSVSVEPQPVTLVTSLARIKIRARLIYEGNTSWGKFLSIVNNLITWQVSVKVTSTQQLNFFLFSSCSPAVQGWSFLPTIYIV